MNPLPPVIFWDENSISKYGETLMRPEIHKSINDLCVKASESECDTAAHLNCLKNSLKVIHRSKQRKWKPKKRN